MAGTCASEVSSGDDAECAPTSGTDPSTRIIEAAYYELHKIACAKARTIVRSPVVAEDMVQDVWLKMLSGTSFDPDRGPFAAFFLTSVRNRCLKELHDSRSMPASDDMIEWFGLRYQEDFSEHDEALERIADLETRIAEALTVLKLTPPQAEKLRMMIGPEPPTRSAADSDSDRQARRRLRIRVESHAKLTDEERNAASLIRQHHDPVTAAAAGGIEVGDLKRMIGSAERKILGLFNIPGED
jgi:RNA polymerase sigma factor (sigma-70 family)